MLDSPIYHYDGDICWWLKNRIFNHQRYWWNYSIILMNLFYRMRWKKSYGS